MKFFTSSSSSSSRALALEVDDTKMSTQFMTLPDELIISVAKDLPEDDLVSLATTCQRLHRISLEILFTRCSIDLASPRLALSPRNLSLKALAGLAILLPVTNQRVMAVSCDLTQCKCPGTMINKAHALTRFLSKLPGVTEVSLHLPSPLFIQWEDAVIDLLGTIMLKGCSKLLVTMASADWSSPPWRAKPMPVEPPPSLRNGPTTLGGWLASWRAAGSSHRVSPPAPPPPERRPGSLQVCHIQTLPNFIRPYYIHMVNCSPIVELALRHVPQKELESFLRGINTPTLTRLILFGCSIPTQGFLRFLTRHSRISYLDLRDNTFSDQNPFALPAGLLPNITTLYALPDSILNHFPPLNTFHILTSIGIPIGDKSNGYSEVPRIFECVAQCENDVTLSLNFTVGEDLEGWLFVPAPSQPEPGRLETTLSCVTALELDTSIQLGLSDGVLDRLPRWMSLFPRLERVSLTPTCFLNTIEPSSGDHRFIQDIAKFCPRIRSFALKMRAGWTYTFPDHPVGQAAAARGM